MKKSNLVDYLIWLILGTLICIRSVTLGLGDFHKPGPGFMPFLLGGSLGLLSGISILLTNSKKLIIKEEIRIENFSAKEKQKWFFFTWFVLFGYVMLLKPLGFLIVTFLFLFSLFKLTEPKKWLMPLALSGVVLIVIYLLFSVWLQCRFPRGIFELG